MKNLPLFPVIVGVPRSGTTLLRLMLDAHPELAIPPETGFLLEPQILEARVSPAEIARRIMSFPFGAPAWGDFAIPEEVFAGEVAYLPPSAGLAEVLRVFYRLYADRFAKLRWGDKTPMYLQRMQTIHSILPEARFIHIIRDGRDVALSWQQTWFAPSRNTLELVQRWAELVREARIQAQGLPYLEVRYEDLLTDTEGILQKISQFLDLEFSLEMLGYHRNAKSRLREHRNRYSSDGTLLVSHNQRLNQQKKAMLPPDAKMIGQWKTKMSQQEKLACLAIMGDLAPQKERLFSVPPGGVTHLRKIPF